MRAFNRVGGTCSVAIILFVVTTAVGQQAGVTQPYPDTQGYAQGTTATYPQTPAGVQALPAQPGAMAAPQATASQVPQSPAAQVPVVPQAPPGFQLNALEQAALDQVLAAWQQQSGKVVTFSCPFDRLEYVAAFGPVINGQLAPLNKNKGELTYAKPDKGSFQITEIYTYKEQPAPADNPQAPKRGDWVKQPDAIGEHWVCDGKSIYEFRANQKQVIERPLPPQMIGQNIIDGPLPFLFGADAEKLKQRYWMKVNDKDNTDPTHQVWITALPRFQQQAADFSQVDMILDRARQLPRAMQVTLPNKDRHVYVFQIEQAKVNNPLDRIQQALFERPRTPFGWKHVVENAPVSEAVPLQAQPTR